MKYRIILTLVFIFHTSLRGVAWQSLAIYRLHTTHYRNSLLNPDNQTIEALSLEQGHQHLFSQYFSIRTAYKNIYWETDFLGTCEPNGRWWKNKLDIKQCYIQIDFLKNGLLIVGRKILQWGTGYAFNPTNVVTHDKDLSDPDNSEKRTDGQDMINLEFFGRSYSMALCYMTSLHSDSEMQFKISKWAFRFYRHIFDLDLSWVILVNKHESPIWGMNLSYVAGNRCEIHAEISTQMRSYRHYHPAIKECNILYEADPFQVLKQKDNRLYSQYLVGLQYTFPGNILWIIEYFHQDHGYHLQEWQDFMQYIHFLNTELNTHQKIQALGNLLWSLQILSPKGAIQDYLMNHLNIPICRNITFKSTWLINLNDGSTITIPELEVQIGNHFTFYGRSYIFQGTCESEFGALFMDYSIEGGCRLQ